MFLAQGLDGPDPQFDDDRPEYTTEELLAEPAAEESEAAEEDLEPADEAGAGGSVSGEDAETGEEAAEAARSQGKSLLLAWPDDDDTGDSGPIGASGADGSGTRVATPSPPAVDAKGKRPAV